MRIAMEAVRHSLGPTVGQTYIAGWSQYTATWTQAHRQERHRMATVRLPVIGAGGGLGAIQNYRQHMIGPGIHCQGLRGACSAIISGLGMGWQCCARLCTEGLQHTRRGRRRAHLSPWGSCRHRCSIGWLPCCCVWKGWGLSKGIWYNYFRQVGFISD